LGIKIGFLLFHLMFSGEEKNTSKVRTAASQMIAEKAINLCVASASFSLAIVHNTGYTRTSLQSGAITSIMYNTPFRHTAIALKT